MHPISGRSGGMPAVEELRGFLTVVNKARLIGQIGLTRITNSAEGCAPPKGASEIGSEVLVRSAQGKSRKANNWRCLANARNRE